MVIQDKLSITAVSQTSNLLFDWFPDLQCNLPIQQQIPANLSNVQKVVPRIPFNVKEVDGSQRVVFTISEGGCPIHHHNRWSSQTGNGFILERVSWSWCACKTDLATHPWAADGCGLAADGGVKGPKNAAGRLCWMRSICQILHCSQYLKAEWTISRNTWMWISTNIFPMPNSNGTHG